ncbi:hypothetical protein RD792_014807 [Penstemon davidsonii]|uniref:Uncharacterized protein n=1 Tax=Penstemon davidsonii TaxID=160366 RepID=A0ABR0CQA4_9LAMI|nr:hypothetical protein RD792_014807 [Penstemon davidsonii]
MSKLLLLLYSRRFYSSSTVRRFSYFSPDRQINFHPRFPLNSRIFSTDGNGVKANTEEAAPPRNDSKGGYEYDDEKYPKGEFIYKQRSAWERFMVKAKLFFAFPWQRFENGSLLKIKIRGEISDQAQLKRSFSRAMSLPQICDNLVKAAYDPRVVGIYLHIETLNCGWGKLDEIRRHILDFKKSGKFIVGYVPTCQVKEYYIGCACDELYVPPSAYVGFVNRIDRKLRTCLGEFVLVTATGISMSDVVESGFVDGELLERGCGTRGTVDVVRRTYTCKSGRDKRSTCVLEVVSGDEKGMQTGSVSWMSV